MSRNHQTRTDAEQAELDVPALLLSGLPHDPRVFSDGVIAAALAADRLDVQPRSITFLAEIVRRGGIDFATTLPEPLPTPQSAELARSWIEAAAQAPWADKFEGGDTLARWLDAVATVLSARRSRAS
jgi:hypothetical protein